MPGSVPEKLWTPTDDVIKHSNLTHYNNWLRKEYNLRFPDYASLWKWSVDYPADFWETISIYFNITHHTPYKQVMSDDAMPYTRRFEGSTLNYAEHIFRNRFSALPAIWFQSERQPLMAISWEELENKVASLQTYLQKSGVQAGDRVVAYLPNIPEATVAWLATISLGAIWSSCSPDFGESSVTDRFKQIETKI